jgi:hypothetical protein
MNFFNNLALVTLNELTRFITGQLFTEKQIRSITSHAVGKHLSDWFPEPESEIRTQERVKQAKLYINEASLIIASMQEELVTQSAELDELLKAIDEKKRLAERYANLAQTSAEKFSAFKVEMEEALRQELRRQSEKGKFIRLAVSFSLWFITLVLGAALGAYFRDITGWLTSVFG